MRVLITGGRGFIGSYLYSELLAHPQVGSILATTNRYLPIDDDDGNFHQIDLTLSERVEEMLHGFQPHIIFHLAGNSIVKKDQRNPTKISLDNYYATHNLLEHCPEGCKFVFASSVTVYGNSDFRIVETDEHSPTSVYGATKSACETLIKTYESLGKIDSVILRYVANVGLSSTHGIVHDFVKKLRSHSKYLEVFGESPGTIKPYISVHDTVDATIFTAFDDSCSKQSYNISTSDNLSALGVAEAVMQAIDIYKPIRWAGEKSIWKGDNRKFLVSNLKIKSKGWFPRYNKSKDAIIGALTCGF